MIKFDANKFRAAMFAVSDEARYLTGVSDETRYYLTGVCVQPHAAGGVILIATDGATLVAIHDETGMFMPEDGATEKIIRLSPDALRACKPIKNRNRLGIVGRQIRIEGTTATVYDVADDYGTTVQAVAVSERCIIDGTFPNWRRIVPQVPSIGDHKGHAFFSIEPLTILTKVAKALAGDAKYVGVRITSVDRASAAFVEFFPSHVSAFGVIMPLKGDDAAPAWPAWFAKPQASAAAA